MKHCPMSLLNAKFTITAKEIITVLSMQRSQYPLFSMQMSQRPTLRKLVKYSFIQ